MNRMPVWAAGAAIAVTGAIALTAPSGSADAIEVAPRGPAPALLAASVADRLIAADPGRFHATAEDVLEQRSNVVGAELRYVAYERTHRGLPVIGGDAVVVTDAAGGVLSTWVAQRTELALASTTATVSAARASEVAARQLRTVETAAPAQLSVLAAGGGTLAYEVVVTGADAHRAPARLHVMVDARSGAVIKDWSWNEITHATGNGAWYGKQDLGNLESGKMVDTARKGLQCGGQNGSPYTSSTGDYGNGGAMDLPSGCADVVYAAQKEADMLKEWLGRDGVDGSGRWFPARVGLGEVNAYWNGQYATFGNSQDKKRQLTNIDVVAHEYGHGIFGNTPGAGGYQGEVGGMNESAGDIFGALTEHYANHPSDKPDYEVGELPNLAGKGPIRYMYEPSKVGDPNCMWTGSAPEVHKGAGPQNHWFYLLAEGSAPTNGQPKSPTCNNSTLTGLGIQKAGKIFMATLMRKTSSWSHTKARTASVAAAKELFPTGSECAAVQKAWDAVSVKSSGSESCPAG